MEARAAINGKNTDTNVHFLRVGKIWYSLTRTLSYNQNSINVDENNNNNNNVNNNNDDGNDGDVSNIEIDTSNLNNNNKNDDDDDGVDNLMNEVIQAVVETEEPSGPEVKAHLIRIESDEEIGAEEKRRPASASSSFAMGMA